MYGGVMRQNGPRDLRRAPRDPGREEPMTSAHAAVGQARRHLEAARQGLADLEGLDPRRRLAGLYNVAVWGRSVTLALQLMKSEVDGWEEWWTVRQAEMEGDPLCRYFYNMRTDALHKLAPRPSVSTYIGYLNTDDVVSLTRPQGAKSFFIGDQMGGNGWEVELPDGSIDRVYVELPSTIDAQSTLNLPDGPQSHLGESLPDRSAVTASRIYVAYLARLVEAGAQRFL